MTLELAFNSFISKYTCDYRKYTILWVSIRRNYVLLNETKNARFPGAL
jgi:hypothetical protein